MRRRASPPLSYGIPPPPPRGIGILWWELVTLFFISYTNDIVSQLDLSCFYSFVKKIIKAFFFCRLTGNFLHCCTLWFVWRFLNLFPYSVLSFCILDWIVSTHIKENVNSLVEPLQTYHAINDACMADGWKISPAADAFFCSSFACATLLVFCCDLARCCG